LEEKFGVSAAAVAVAGPAAGGAPAEEKDAFTVVLRGFGEQKIGVMKVIKESSRLGLKKPRTSLTGAPATQEGMKKRKRRPQKKIEEAGGR